MSNYRRPRISGATIFFTVALQERGSSLLVHEIERLRCAVRQTRAERWFDIEAWVVLPDHMHCIWRLPDEDDDFPVRWRLIKSRFSMGLESTATRQSHVRRREKGIWQRRFWEHHIRNAEDWQNHLRYCWFNPVKHGLVGSPADWPFSSYQRDRVRYGVLA
jgi:putative transposase